jgi:hypothetical protein
VQEEGSKIGGQEEEDRRNKRAEAGGARGAGGGDEDENRGRKRNRLRGEEDLGKLRNEVKSLLRSFFLC